MKTELNSKDYVAFARRFVKELVEDMDIADLDFQDKAYIIELQKRGDKLMEVK